MLVCLCVCVCLRVSISSRVKSRVCWDFLTAAWLSVAADSQRSLSLFLTLTHTLLAAFSPFLPLSSPPSSLSLLAGRVSHCLQAFHSAVLSPCSWRYFSIQSEPLHVVTCHQARPCISSPTCLLGRQLPSTWQSDGKCLQLFWTWKLAF